MLMAGDVGAAQSPRRCGFALGEERCVVVRFHVVGDAEELRMLAWARQVAGVFGGSDQRQRRQ